MGTVEGSTTAGISSTVDGETTTTNGEGSTTPAGETTPDPCTDKDGEEFCLTKIDKCDKPNIIERCEKTCGQCPTTVPVSTTIEGSTTVGISSTVGEETTTSDGEASTTTIGDPTEKTTTDGEGSTTPAGETTPDPCTDKDGEEFCLTKVDKCDKPN